MSVQAKDTGDLEWTICDADGNNLYKIVPYSNHLCYNIYEWGATTR